MGYDFTTRWLPESQPEKEAALEQLQRLFDHAAFKQSKRSRALLRYVVEHHLKDENSEFKERCLGIEVFGRKADYDTSSDPVVRNAASEVRKRIAQYYSEPGHENEIRFELPVGSYTPEIYQPSAAAASETNASHSSKTSIPVERSVEWSKPARGGWGQYAILSGLLMALTGLAVFAARRNTQRPHLSLNSFGIPAGHASNSSTSRGSLFNGPIRQFWSPVISRSMPMQICVGTFFPGPPRFDTLSQPTAMESTNWRARVPWHDLLASTRIAGFLDGNSIHYYVENAKVTTLSDLLRGPAVFVGGFENPWLQKFVRPLRFHFVRAAHSVWIADRDSAAKQYASGPGKIPGSTRDYAVIGRFFNKSTGQITVVLSGIHAPATMAAADFVTNAQDMNRLSDRLPKGWQSKNIEVLLSVDTTHGETGAPTIQSVAVW